MARQALWLQAIERRLAATSAALAAMKGVKMCGLTDSLLENLHQLRIDEMRIARKFRILLIWNLAFGEWAWRPGWVYTISRDDANCRQHGSHP